jgi:transcriptional regulator with XRE-family HTH domain
MPSDTKALDPEDVRVGATIRALREAYGLERAELATAIGKSEQLVGFIERGERRATPPVCRDIAKTLGIPLAAITVKDYEQLRKAGS